jgi:hypothetical protein
VAVAAAVTLHRQGGPVAPVAVRGGSAVQVPVRSCKGTQVALAWPPDRSELAAGEARLPLEVTAHRRLAVQAAVELPTTSLACL